VDLKTAIERGFLRAHQGIYEGTGGRIGHRLVGVPCLLLRTTGAKTGRIRTSALVYARDGDDYVVTASNGGADRAPGWLHNVRARPQVEVQVARDRFVANAREITNADPDYSRLWELVNEGNHHRYEEYQRRTTRPIPLVALAPA
jgi:deazaflavin-dependent oxidoreductase (nitroreductase family)